VNAPLTLASLHTMLGWPLATEVTHPGGAGANVFAALAREKIGRTLARYGDGKDAIVGVLMGNTQSHATEPPLALVVQFMRNADEATLCELHRMAWNFSHSPILITIEPSLVRVFTCCEAPNPTLAVSQFCLHQTHADEFPALENRAVNALHWINLVSGEFFKPYAARLNRNGRADQMLLGNLRTMRKMLGQAGLSDDDVCHDLLARIIFVKFLFDRKDADGVAALTPAKLAKLHADGVLQKVHHDLAGVLANYEDIWQLFDWLNVRFNGDLFPGKGDTTAARAAGWAKEKAMVNAAHLALLADFVSGAIDLNSGQQCLWPQYSFDVIPLEFISSIYETFVADRAARDGIYYTPPHLVDFVLDRVLPWHGMEWNVKIIDPACGSGIFLVKAFQRLVYRWKQAHPSQVVRAETLRHLLERNIFGVDIDPHAVRVACFSLYLAMCDEIEPRHYWTQVVFPNMRGRRLICSDFFVEGAAGFTTVQDADSYDLVIGNAPWGGGLVTEAASAWAKGDGRTWTIANKDIGCLFLVKGAQLLRPNGQMAMIQSANSMLFNNGMPTALAFRRQLFSTHQVQEVFNLSALRFQVFDRKSHASKTSLAPACVMVMNKTTPAPQDRIAYISPKHLKPLLDEFVIQIEPQDSRWLTQRDVLDDDLIWVALTWGGHRDWGLLKKLRSYPSIDKSGADIGVKSSRGINYGSGTKLEPQLDGRCLFDQTSFPDTSFLTLDSDAFPKMQNIMLDGRASTDFRAFAWPQLLVKQSWQTKVGRFQARLVTSSKQEAVICNRSYLSVHGPEKWLQAACLAFNSQVATYFLLLSSGRFAAYRPEPQVFEWRTVPVPPVDLIQLEQITNLAELDQQAFAAFGLKDAERALIEDMCNITLADFKGGVNSPGLQSTQDKDESCLSVYCQYLMRVLKAGFGADKNISATIFQSPGKPLPYRLIAIELGKMTPGGVQIEKIRSTDLLAQLERLDMQANQRRGIYSQRVARIYDTGNGRPTIFIIKPDMVRYWSRSVGLHDGDEIAADLLRSQQAAPKKIALA
jgi:hypothetical protein